MQKIINSSTCFQMLKKKITNYESHEIYISQESFINDKVQLSYVQCTLKEIKQPIPTWQFFAKHENKIK